MELREKIARLLFTLETQGDALRFEDDFVKKLYLDKANLFLDLIKGAGYVKLAESQMLPNYVTFDFQDRKKVDRVQQDMLKIVDGKAFRRVILEVKDACSNNRNSIKCEPR